MKRKFSSHSAPSLFLQGFEEIARHLAMPQTLKNQVERALWTLRSTVPVACLLR